MDSAQKFTPGPWHPFSSYADTTGQGSPDQIRDPKDEPVAYLPSRYYDKPANAHLIAAAPELYEALEGIFKAAATGHFFNGHPSHAAGLAALAKARGEP